MSVYLFDDNHLAVGLQMNHIRDLFIEEEDCVGTSHTFWMS